MIKILKLAIFKVLQMKYKKKTENNRTKNKIGLELIFSVNS